MGSDPASVAFDTLQSAVAQDADIVIIDTAGRLHNKINLMNELTKVKRVMQKVVIEAHGFISFRWLNWSKRF
jgi:fused signal recognition particle receptor